mgnify:FL=1
MFNIKFTNLWGVVLLIAVGAAVIHLQPAGLEADEPVHREMIATTDKALRHLKDGKLRYCIIRSSEIFCIEETK